MNRALIAGFTALALVCTFLGLGNLIQLGPWTVHMIAFPLLITVVMSVMTALLARFPGWATAASWVLGVVAWVCYLCGLTTQDTIVPTPRTLRTVVEHVEAAVIALPQYGRPAPIPELFVPLALIGLGPVCILAVFWAVNVERPVWVGLPLLACWGVFLSGSPNRGLAWAVLAGASYLMLLAVSPRKGRIRQTFRPVAVPVVAVSAVVGVVASMLAPLAPRWGQSEQWQDLWQGGYLDGTGISMAGQFPVDDQLRTESSVVLFHTSADVTEPLTIGSLTTFTGRTWSSPSSGDNWDPSSNTGVRFYQTGQVLWNNAITGSSQPTSPGPQWTPSSQVTVTIDQLSGHALPTGIGPRSVVSAGGLSLVYNPKTDSIGSMLEVRPGDSYSTTVMALDRSSLAGRPVNGVGSLSVTQSVQQIDQISQLTRSVIGSATTEDEILLAIQSYLRGPGFSYTLTPRWVSTGDPVWDFLTNKQGYCVHFATAMAVMAASVGIQTRVSVGYLPGQLGADGTRTVTGAQAHMWPEAFFAGIGWVRYEPTPAVDASTSVPGPTPTAPTAQPTTPAATPSPSNQVTDSPPTRTPGATQSPTSAPPVVSSSRTLPWSGFAGAGALAVLIIVVAIWLVYVFSYTPERSIRRLRRAGLRAGIVTEGMSVRAVLDILPQADRPVGLDELRAHLELSRYGPPDLRPGRLKGLTWWRLTRTVLTRLRRGR
ncbi:MAG: transglutaminaseTgpA domain-containing protein [Propionibacteriaceae bacterium]|nr:transglutaminaseTgpA domain-containing protein [Propionibacteriaceae bacterium]